jgi:hypothetical protein
MLRMWATKKGPLRCATALLSSFLGVFAAKSAVAQRANTTGLVLWYTLRVAIWPILKNL